jgi:hypothetical protein
VHATLDRATGDLLFDIRRGQRARRFRAPRASAAAAQSPDWLALVSGDPTALIREAFKALARFALQKVGDLAGQKAGNTVLGWVLAAFGLGDELENRDMVEIQKALDALSEQLTRLQGQVARAEFSVLVGQTNDTIGRIKHAASQLALLANTPATDDRKATFAETIVKYIGKNLVDAPAILNQHLGSDVPLSDNLIKSASRAVSTRDRFFDEESSDQVKSVYDYFAAYQVKLAVLLAEYYHAKPDTFSPEVVKANLEQIERNVTAQAASLKPPVPAGTVVDVKTGVMWMQTIDGSPLRKITDLVRLVEPPDRGPYLALTNTSTSTRVPGLPFDNWAMPDAEDLYKLLSHRPEGQDGVEFLARQARISRRLLDAANSHVWIRDTFECRYTFTAAVYRLFSLRAAAVAGETVRKGGCISFVWNDPKFANENVQAILFRRVRAAGEDYWWG